LSLARQLNERIQLAKKKEGVPIFFCGREE